jgi:hypothetical protein
VPQAASAYADTRNMYAIHMLFRREFGLLSQPGDLGSFVREFGRPRPGRGPTHAAGLPGQRDNCGSALP